MNDVIISVAYFAKDEKIKNSVLTSDELRQKTLGYCYLMPNYKLLTLKEKNKIYDKIKELYRREF